jgi:superfamily I DNA and RNA helicase
LRKEPKLKNGREFLVGIDTITYTSSDLDKLPEKLSQLNTWHYAELFDNVVSAFQSISNLKAKNSRKIKKLNSRGAKIQWLDNELSVLDNEQEKAIIEYTDGIQRIRGLAGSGKTIVLALKAAHLHTQNPDWDIVVTFNTRSLKQQYKDLITKFCHALGNEPDWNKLKVINAWGKAKENPNGLYYIMCIENDFDYLDFKQAESYAINIGIKKEQAFEIACKKVIDEVKNKNKKIREKYDVILVDEAQDLSHSFLNMCILLLKSPTKRLIYAGDELQRLNEGENLPSPKSLRDFGVDDKILKRCYRNSKPLLVTAHALGFGIYREKGLVQFFDLPKLWSDVGYEVSEGKLEAGQKVVLRRSAYSSPSYLENISEGLANVTQSIDDLLIFKAFKNKQEQAEWVAEQINRNLKEDELGFNDIIIINPLGLTTRNEVALIRNVLAEKYEINGHIAGDNDADIFFENNSVTFTGIHRAKGNEVPMVYIINADECYEGTFNAQRDLIKRRNTLFTAITRSKAWVRVCGTGSQMDKLINEFEQVKKRNFVLGFIYPTPTEIEKMNLIHRDISNEEKQELRDAENISKNFSDILLKIKNGKVLPQDLSEETQQLLKDLNIIQ